MSDPISSVALIVAIFSGLASLMNTLHIRKCNAGCFRSDCTKNNSPPNSPLAEQPKKKAVSFQDKKDNDSSLSV
jgi:hypothetical protein